MDHQYITEKEVSNLTNIAVQTLRNHRSMKIGIPYCKIGKSIRYSFQDVIQYMESKKIVYGKR